MERAEILAKMECLQAEMAALQNALAESEPTPEHKHADTDVLAPRVHDGPRCIEYRGRTCEVRSRQLLDLWRRLIRRPGWYVRDIDLLAAVWGPTAVRTDTALRQAVCRLRKLLRNAGMPDLAEAIDGSSVAHAYRLRPVWLAVDVTEISRLRHSGITALCDHRRVTSGRLMEDSACLLILRSEKFR